MTIYDLKPDFEISKQRFAAFWKCDLLDRPLVQFPLFKPENERQNLPVSRHETQKAALLDTGYQAEWHLINLSNQVFLGDTLPVVYPSLGPAIMPAFYGCPLHFIDDGTSWNEPMRAIVDRQEILTFNWQSAWLKHLHQLTDAFLITGAGHFITGMSDWYMAGDCLAAVIGPEQLAIALVENPAWVKHNLDQIQKDFERLYLELHTKLNFAGQPSTTWVPLLSEGKYYVVANDFSTMISTSLYREIFQETVIRECQFLDHSIYHLDGLGALRHLDAILEVDDLDGVYFIPSPNEASFDRWAGVYKRIQDAGKCLIVNCDLAEIKRIPHVLKPEGLLLNIQNVSSLDDAQALLSFMERWPTNDYSK
jgi:hypothetical protein